MKDKEKDFYMNVAKSAALMSHANRKKVGAVLVEPQSSDILSYGYNGTPTGFDNTCEDNDGKTKPNVIHAESNALLKCAKTGKPVEGSILFVTMSPCTTCSISLIQAGVKEVVYVENYRNGEGLQILKEAGVKVSQYENNK